MKISNFVPRAVRNLALFAITAVLTMIMPAQVRAGSSSFKGSSYRNAPSKQSSAKSKTSSKSNDRDDDRKGSPSKSDKGGRDDRDHGTKGGDDDCNDDDHHSGSGDHHDGGDRDDDDCSGGGGGGVVLIPVNVVNTTGTQLVINLGDSGTLTAQLIAGSEPVTYQWMKRNSLGAFSAIPGATGLTLILPNTTESDTGEYWIVATNALGSVSSTHTQVVIASQLDVLNTSGSEVLIAPGENGTLTAELLAGTQPVTYQWWRRNSAGVVSAVPGGTALTLNIVNASETDSGQYWIVATNSTGSVSSSETQVIVAFASE